MAVAFMAGVVLAMLCDRRVRRIVRFTGRYLAGHPLDGIHRTNATWGSPATRVLHPTGHASRWHRWPGKHRAAVRVGAPVAAAAVLAGLAAATLLTVVSLAIAGAAAAGYGGWRLYGCIRRWPHERHYVRPLKWDLTREIGAPPVTLAIARDGDAVTSVAIGWAPETDLGDDEQKRVLQAVSTRLAIEAPDAEWRRKGRNRSVVFTQSEPPPSDVVWDDVADAVTRAASNELVFGLGKRGALVKASYSESPHVAIPGGSGGGKSNLAAFLLLQELMRGSLIFNLDPKWISHLWLQDLPNVISAHDAPQLELALTWLGKELVRRTKSAYYSSGGTGRVRGKHGCRIIVQAEELNYGMPGLKENWRETRTKDDPKRSPAIAGLEALSCAGRASDMHEWLIAQMLTVASTGVSDSTIRGNAGIKAMARWDPPGWAMAVGKHIAMPPQNTTPGRIQVVTGDVPRETQVPYLHLDDKDPGVADKAVAWARELAVSGVVAEIPGGPDGVPEELWPASVLGQAHLALPPGQGAETPRTETGSRVLSLRDACDGGVLRSGLGAARKASQRPGFPAAAGWDGKTALYSHAELAAWQDGRRS